MAGRLVFRIGMSPEAIDREIVPNVEAAVAAADCGESVGPRRTLSFETWTGFLRGMAPNRVALLEHVAAQDGVASTRAVSIASGRDCSAVHADVAELVKLGLLERDGTALHREIEPDRAELAAA